jgi:hypothetical protein
VRLPPFRQKSGERDKHKKRPSQQRLMHAIIVRRRQISGEYNKMSPSLKLLAAAASLLVAAVVFVPRSEACAGGTDPNITQRVQQFI